MDKYRPSNATEGDGFISHWCGSCQRTGVCPIVMATMELDVDDEDYPAEWVRGDNGPCCTAHEPIS